MLLNQQHESAVGLRTCHVAYCTNGVVQSFASVWFSCCWT